jgi:hypothetical protein
MAFTVTDFKSKLSANGGGAKPTLFEVTIAASVDTELSLVAALSEQFLVKSTQIPGVTISAETLNYAGRPVKYSGKRTYENWTTTVINDENFAIRNKVMKWMVSMSGTLAGTRGVNEGDNPNATPAYKEGVATVKQLGADGVPTKTFTLNQLWPTSIASIPVDWSADGIEEFSVEWCFDTLVG